MYYIILVTTGQHKTRTVVGVTAKWRILSWLLTATDFKHPNEKRFELRNNKTYKLKKCRNILLESDLKRNAMNIITQNLHCTGAVDRARATLYSFITLDVFALRTALKLKPAACAKTKKLEY